MDSKRFSLDNPTYIKRELYIKPRPIHNIRRQPLIEDIRRGSAVSLPTPKAEITQKPTQHIRSGPMDIVNPLSNTSNTKHAQKIHQPQPVRNKPSRKRAHSKLTIALYSLAIALFVAGITVTALSLKTNHRATAQVEKMGEHTSGGNTDESAPATDRPSDAAIRNYVVAPNLPRYIDIAKLSVHARIMSLSVDNKNQLQSPRNVYDAGWYNASAQPGQPGAMLVDGHVSSWKTKGVFYGLNKLVSGDTVTITRGDNQQFTYKVVKTQIFDADKVDMSSLLVSQDTSKPGLNLISCSGDVIPGTNEFNKRIAVYAVLQ